MYLQQTATRYPQNSTSRFCNEIHFPGGYSINVAKESGPRNGPIAVGERAGAPGKGLPVAASGAGAPSPPPPDRGSPACSPQPPGREPAGLRGRRQGHQGPPRVVP